MSSRSSNTSVGAVLEASDDQPETTASQELQEAVEVATASELGTGAIDVDRDVEGFRGDATETRAIAGESEWPAGDDSECGDPQEASETLAQKLAQLVHSVSIVEELSRCAREAAIGDLAVYDSLEASQQQYADGLEQARAIRDQARQVHERAFGQQAKHAAEPIVAD